jgi:hypothetical protein
LAVGGELSAGDNDIFLRLWDEGVIGGLECVKVPEIPMPFRAGRIGHLCDELTTDGRGGGDGFRIEEIGIAFGDFESFDFPAGAGVVERTFGESAELYDLAGGFDFERVWSAGGLAEGADLPAGVGVVGGGGLAADQELTFGGEVNCWACDDGGRELDRAYALPRLVAFGDPCDRGGGQEDQDQGAAGGFEEDGAPGGAGGLVGGVVERGHA